MKRIIIYILLIAMSAACTKNGSSTSPVSKDGAPLISEISVLCGQDTVEIWSFDYDSDGRLAKLLRRDKIASADILDLSYAYSDAGIAISGTMNGSSYNLNVAKTSGSVSYEAGNGWTYTTSLNSKGVAQKTTADCDFQSTLGNYASSYSYYENYSLSGNDIVVSTRGSSIKGKAAEQLSMQSSVSLDTEYGYTDNVDRQNFASLIFDDAVPVWFACGLPGCDHLIKKISVSTTVDTVLNTDVQTFSYELFDSGDIKSVARSFSNNTAEYLKLTYCFTYSNGLGRMLE